MLNYSTVARIQENYKRFGVQGISFFGTLNLNVTKSDFSFLTCLYMDPQHHQK